MSALLAITGRGCLSPSFCTSSGLRRLSMCRSSAYGNRTRSQAEVWERRLDVSTSATRRGARFRKGSRSARRSSRSEGRLLTLAEVLALGAR